MSTSCDIVPRANVGPYLYDYEDSFIFLYPNLNVGLEETEPRMFGKQDYNPYLSNVFFRNNRPWVVDELDCCTTLDWW